MFVKVSSNFGDLIPIFHPAKSHLSLRLCSSLPTSSSNVPSSMMEMTRDSCGSKTMQLSHAHRT
jgi:hypothetical protein